MAALHQARSGSLLQDWRQGAASLSCANAGKSWNGPAIYIKQLMEGTTGEYNIFGCRAGIQFPASLRAAAADRFHDDLF